MAQTLNKIVFIFTLALFSLSAYHVLKHWNYQEALADLNQSVRHQITQKAISNEIQSAINKAEFDDARMYLSIAHSNNYLLDFSYYQQQINRKDTQLRKVVTQATHFTKGFINGKSANVAGVAGSVVADFTVVGDVRDLNREYDKYQKGDGINELVVLLSGAGVGLTALTVGSLGTVAPAKIGASVIKVAVKTRRITRGFQKHLVKLGRNVFDWTVFTRLLKQNKATGSVRNIRTAASQAYHPAAIEPLKNIASQVNGIRKSTSTIDTVHLLKYIDSPKDLARLEKVTVKYGRKTKGFMTLLGKGALRTVRVLRKTTALILSLICSVVSGFTSSLMLFRIITLKLLF